MNAVGRNSFVGAHHADLPGASKNWASSNDDKELRMLVETCVPGKEMDRPLMKEVYLRRAGWLPLRERWLCNGEL